MFLPKNIEIPEGYSVVDKYKTSLVVLWYNTLGLIQLRTCSRNILRCSCIFVIVISKKKSKLTSFKISLHIRQISRKRYEDLFSKLLINSILTSDIFSLTQKPDLLSVIPHNFLSSDSFEYLKELNKKMFLITSVPAYCEPIPGHRVGVARCPAKLLKCFQLKFILLTLSTFGDSI